MPAKTLSPAIIERPLSSLRPYVPTSLRPYVRNAQTHSKKQIKQIAASIEGFSFVNSVLIGHDGEI